MMNKNKYINELVRQIEKSGHRYDFSDNLEYSGTKENMAIRCGLIDQSKIFNETEMKLIYTNLIGYVGLNPHIDYKSEKVIGTVLDKIESIVPEIKRHEDYEKL